MFLLFVLPALAGVALLGTVFDWFDFGSDDGPEGVELTGTDGADSLAGMDGPDMISGLSGADYLEGGLGDDTLIGEEGADLIDGGDGNNILDGYYDGTDDDLYAARDLLDPDVLQAEGGNNLYILGSGDTAALGTGEDTVVTGTWVDPENTPVVQGFDTRFDQLLIYYPEGYTGALEITFEDQPDVRIQTVLLDGVKVATVDYGSGSPVTVDTVSLFASPDFA